MSLIQIISRIKLPSIEDIENESENEKLGLEGSKGKWCWRRRTIMSSDIIGITSYDSKHTLMNTEYEGYVLVRESYDSLHAKWAAIYEQSEEDIVLEEDARQKRRSEPENNEDGENTSEDEEE